MAQYLNAGEYMTVDEASACSGLAPITLRAHIRSGRLPAYRFGPVYVVASKDVEVCKQRRLAALREQTERIEQIDTTRVQP